MTKLKLHFEDNQQHQLHAVRSVTNLFENIFPESSAAAFDLSGGEIVSNLPEGEYLDPEYLRDNLRAVQEQNNAERAGSRLDLAHQIELDAGLMFDWVGFESVEAPHFTLEMETGTGKTYVYFRTMRELFKAYGMRKFVIVVPSVAIFEGVKKTFEITRDHFARLYGNDPVIFIEYDGTQIGRLRDFATSTSLSVLLITRDAFNKASNVIYKTTEKLPGEMLPIQYIQATRPIVILDEPQNMSGEKASQALRTLNPLAVLRYSATHRETPNLVYRLTPVDAFRQGLVKQIEVIGVTQLSNQSVSTPCLESIDRGGKNTLTARVRALTITAGQASEQVHTLRQGDDLFAKTHHPDHQGYKVAEIRKGADGAPDFVAFENGVRIAPGEMVMGSRDVFRAQIERTIEEHFRRQNALEASGVKVLSLFFIDRVANYTADDGLIKRLFDEAFERLKHKSPLFALRAAGEVRSGYFAKKREKDRVVEVDLEDLAAKDREKAEKEAFSLIMRDKERLLSFEQPVSFIFAHSALREGWDNPNVFQICTLNQSVSEVKKRQEIGRGLRLCVNQTGRRSEDPNINVLTVIANESYESYVNNLQSEYDEDGVEAPPKPRKPEESTVRRREGIFRSAEFRDFWAKLSRKLDYTVEVDTDMLIEECVTRLHDPNLTRFPEPTIIVSRGKFVMKDYTIELLAVDEQHKTLRLRVGMESTDAGEHLLTDEPTTFSCLWKDKEVLERIVPDLKHKKFKFRPPTYTGGEWVLPFENGQEVGLHSPLSFRLQQPKGSEREIQQQEAPDYPVVDFVARTVEETGLTRHTIAQIFERLNKDKRRLIFKNPEGWTNTFVAAVREAAADHIAARLDFRMTDERFELDEFFPEEPKFAQNELIDGGQKSLYDRVQVDSNVEKGFVQVLKQDELDVVLYLKFPPKFKLHFPKIVGNYNPDWAIVRRSEDGKVTLQLVRETKGNEDASKLRFTSEGRKILAAERYFKHLGIDYRHITDKTVDYWRSKPGSDPDAPLGLGAAQADAVRTPLEHQ